MQEVQAPSPAPRLRSPCGSPRPPGGPVSAEARALLSEARSARSAGNLSLCVSRATGAFEEAREDPCTAFNALQCVARAYMGAGESGEALRWYTTARDWAKSLGLREHEAH